MHVVHVYIHAAICSTVQIDHGDYSVHTYVHADRCTAGATIYTVLRTRELSTVYPDPSYYITPPYGLDM